MIAVVLLASVVCLVTGLYLLHTDTGLCRDCGEPTGTRDCTAWRCGHCQTTDADLG